MPGFMTLSQGKGNTQTSMLEICSLRKLLMYSNKEKLRHNEENVTGRVSEEL